MKEYCTIFSFYLYDVKLTGHLKTLHPIDEYYPLHYYIQNVINENNENIDNISIIKKYENDSEDSQQYNNKIYDLYIIDDHYLYYQYIYQQKKGIFYYSKQI